MLAKWFQQSGVSQKHVIVGIRKVFSYLVFKLDVCKPFGFSHLILNQPNFSYFTKLQCNKQYAFTIFSVWRYLRAFKTSTISAP